MNVPLPSYAKVKDKFCVAYFGNCNDYLVQLKLLRPIMEKRCPGVQVYIACRDNAIDVLQGQDRVLRRSDLKKEDFGYVREIICDMQSHPVEQFMKESGLPCGPVATGQHKRTGKCVLVTQAMLPARSLTPEEINTYKGYLVAEGCDLSIDGDIADAEFVMGVESDKLFQAGANGARVALVPTGFGENIFKCMYPRGTVLKF